MNRTIIAAACSALVAGGAGYWVGHTPRVTGGAVQGMTSPAPGAEDDRILYYRNPMGLADTSPVPKNDVMGMAYIPVHAKDAQESGSVTISPGRMQTLGVRTAPVESRAALIRTVRATGVVKLDERRLATVIDGLIK